MPDLNARVPRRLARALALTPAVLLPLAALPATAAAPEGWPDIEDPSVMGFLLVLVVIPVALFALISLLAYVPTLVRGGRYTPGRSWRGETEWFGGPQAGLEAAERETAAVTAGSGDAQDGRGGASARW